MLIRYFCCRIVGIVTIQMLDGKLFSAKGFNQYTEGHIP